MVHFPRKIKGSLRALASGAFIASLLACKPQTTGDRQAAKDVALISGVVHAQGTETAIAGATVFVVRPSNRPQIRTKTDANGHFVLDGLEEGRHLVAVSQEGYVMPGRQNISGYPYRVATGEHLSNVVIHLIPAGTISGRVLTPDGKPASRVDVQLLQNLYLMGRPQWTLVTPGGTSRNIPVITNERGEFRVAGVDPGLYTVRFVPQELNPATVARGGPAAVPRLYPSLEVKPGSETLLDDIRLQEERRGWIRLLVMNQSGESLEGLGEWELRPPGWIGAEYALAQTRIVNDYHEFQPDSPGAYDIIASWLSPRGLLAGVTRVDYRGVDIQVTLVIRKPDGKLTGHVKPALAGIEVAIGPKISYFARTRPDGTLTFPDVYPGRYQLGYVRGIPEDSFLSSVMQGSRDVLRDDILVGDREAELEITLSPGAAVLTGSVTGGSSRPVHNALVALVPESPLKERKDYYGTYKDTRTDQNGAFEIRGITPGLYHAYAWTEAPAGAFRNTEFMKTFTDKGTAIRLELGGKPNVSLKTLN